MTTLEDTRSEPGLSARGRWRALRVVLLCSAAMLAGCASINPFAAARPAPSVSSPMTPQTVTNAARASAAYERDPKSASAAITYARALREFGSNQAAADLLARAVQFHPDNGELVSEYAKSLTASGQNQAALPVFAEAEKLNKNDWSLLSAEGIALDQLGHHGQARDKYGEALKLSPNNPDVLCNLAFSYTMTGGFADAEIILRKAAKDPDASAQVRQNLAMVVGLQGRFTEARGLARADLDPATADHNVAVMRQIYAQPEMWASAKEERGPALASNAPTNVMADASTAPDDKTSGDKPATKMAAVAAVKSSGEKAAAPKASGAKAPDPKPPGAKRTLAPSGISAAVRPAVSAVPAKTENDMAEPAVEPGLMQKPAVLPAAPARHPAAKAPAVSQHVSAVIESKASRTRQQLAQGNAVDETFFAFN